MLEICLHCLHPRESVTAKSFTNNWLSGKSSGEGKKDCLHLAFTCLHRVLSAINRPIVGISPLKGCSREALFSSSWRFSSGGGAPLPAQILGRSTPGQSPDELRFFLSHFLSRRTSAIRIGPKSAPTSSCDDVPFASAIRSPVTDNAASRRTMSITTGSQSVAVTVAVAGKPSRFCRCFPFRTPTTAC
jgi:hypothetical protein